MTIRRLITFCRDESGAVTVDWVVLTAAIASLGLAVMATVSSGVESVSCTTSDTLANLGPKNTFSTSLTDGAGNC